MLQLFANECTGFLLKRGVIQDNHRKIYVYGFELFLSTLLCIISILSIGVVSGYLSSSVVFLLFFMPIRMVAGGYHAKTYKACFILTNSIAILCVVVSKTIWYLDKSWISYSFWIILFLSFIYIWRAVPMNMEKYSEDPKRVLKNRKYTHAIIGIELLLIIIMRVFIKTHVSYVSVITTCAVALIIYIAKQEEVRS